MTDFERALLDLEGVIESNKWELSRRNVSGAVPMPLRTVQEAYSALKFEKELMRKVRAFEATKQRALDKIDTCDQYTEDMDVADTVHLSCEVMKILLTRYFDKCSKGRFDGT